MAKSLLRIKAIELRKKGESVKNIARTLKVSRSTVSLWTRDIILTKEQIERLTDSMHLGSVLGRMKIAVIRKKRREKLHKQSLRNAMSKLKNLKKREFFIAGLSLYWAEGCKKKRDVEFCNSDPNMIKFIIDWVILFFDVDSKRIRCTVGINEMHREREELVKEYWSKETGIPLEQFSKTSFKKVKNKKVYDNFHIHYGTLSINILKPTIIYYQIMGLIEGLFLVEQQGYKKISQGSSVG